MIGARICKNCRKWDDGYCEENGSAARFLYVMSDFTCDLFDKRIRKPRLYSGIRRVAGRDFHFRLAGAKHYSGFFRPRAGGCHGCEAAQYSPHVDRAVCYKTWEERIKTPGCRRAIPDSSISRHSHYWRINGRMVRVQFERDQMTVTEVDE